MVVRALRHRLALGPGGQLPVPGAFFRYPARAPPRTRCRASLHSNDASTGVLAPTAAAEAVPTTPPAPSVQPSALQNYAASPQAYEVPVSSFSLGAKQLEVIKHLRTSIADCAVAFSAVAATNILLSVVQALGFSEEVQEEAYVVFGNFTVGDVAYWADSLMLVTLLLFALGPFDTVLRVQSNQMARVFQGLDRLGLIFQQLSIGSLAVSTVTALEAAVKYPPIVVFCSEVFFALAIARGLAMGYILRKHSNTNDEVAETLGAVRGCAEYQQKMNAMDRVAATLAFGYLVQHEEKQPYRTIDWDATLHYEFSAPEERVIKGLTESVNTAGLALGLQAFTTLMLTVADFGNEDWTGVVSNGINSANKILCATLVFQASQSFDRALHTEGDDVKHLMNGLGEDGLTNLFDKLAVLAWAVTLAALIGAAAPWLEENYVLTAITEGASHRTAEAIMEALQTAAKILRGV